MAHRNASIRSLDAASRTFVFLSNVCLLPSCFPTQKKKGFVRVPRTVIYLWGGLFSLGLYALCCPIRVGTSRWSGEIGPQLPFMVQPIRGQEESCRNEDGYLLLRVDRL